MEVEQDVEKEKDHGQREAGPGQKRSQNAQPQNEILCSKGLGGAALNKQLVAKWIATSIACHNMLRIK